MLTEHHAQDLRFSDTARRAVLSRSLVQRSGRVLSVLGQRITASLPSARLGELCAIGVAVTPQTCRWVLAEVTAFQSGVADLSCLENTQGLGEGMQVQALGCHHQVDTSRLSPGDVLDGFGRLLQNRSLLRESALADGMPHMASGAFCLHGQGQSVIREAPDALQRPPIDAVLATGVRVLDCTATLGRGQRVGLFAGPGCGKSTLLAQIARGAGADIVVLALVGERGRELREFIEREFDDALRQRCVFVCATSDRSAMERVRAAFTATAIAEHYRDQGASVLLMVDSLTRLARAQREIGLQLGEPATRNGLTPSVYALLPTLIERAGRGVAGDITALYTVLLETEHIHEDVLASEAKSLLDGHWVLRPALAQRGQYPAFSVPDSLSRVMSHLVDADQMDLSNRVRSAYAQYAQVELLLRLNEYQSGSDPEIDRAIAHKPKLDRFFTQDRFRCESWDSAWDGLNQLLGD